MYKRQALVMVIAAQSHGLVMDIVMMRVKNLDVTFHVMKAKLLIAVA